MKKIYFFTVIVLFLCNTSFGQKQYNVKSIAFYNLENLYDTINDPLIDDEASPIMEIKGNKSAVYIQKLNNMAKVLSEIGAKDRNNDSADIIGVCEIENRTVLEDLLKTSYLKDKNYRIIHFDSPDLRGIDVALLYREFSFRPVHSKTYELRLWDVDGTRIYTRDQLLVSGYLDDELIHIIVNHWPSRRGGEAKSRPNREKAAYLNTQIIEEIKITDPNPKVIIMGDLNDDPINTSLKKVLKTKTKLKKVKEGDIYNPMEDMFRRGQNTLVYNDNLNLFDQIMVTEPLIDTKRKFENYKFFKANVYNPQYLTNQTGKYKGYPYRSFAGSNFIGGYSDHYPVYITLLRELKPESQN